jgi:hypothetical protein
MKYIFYLFAFCLFANSSYAQLRGRHITIRCKIDIVRLDFTDNLKVGASLSSVNLLPMAKVTSDTLLKSQDVKSVGVSTVYDCCDYSGYIYSTRIDLSLFAFDQTRISQTDPQLCCGIPVVILANGKEILRAFYWNFESTTEIKELVIVRNGDNLEMYNQFPQVRDSDNGNLMRRMKFSDCIPKSVFEY